jgi:hypothetical protein
MTPSLIFVLATAAASALMTLVFLGLFFVRLPKFFSSAIPGQRKALDGLLLLAYVFFPIQVLTNLAAFGGMFGDGATSMFRSVSPFTLVAVPCIQLAVFLLWAWLRFTRFRGVGISGGVAATIPAVIPAAYVFLWAGRWFHWF